ncbi:hypothetical protein F5883DRAFT_640610 [Diaporthe sp. PMI_573]|nr:hypothetical protein F5883DRAFT_640610 [Diaporthaceae sp. PMI_573]
MRIYDAASAELSKVINNRSRLLPGSRILFALRKQNESKKMTYVFLTRVLGASLSGVCTVDEARKQLKERTLADHTIQFEYVYGRSPGPMETTFLAVMYKLPGSRSYMQVDAVISHYDFTGCRTGYTELSLQFVSLELN